MGKFLKKGKSSKKLEKDYHIKKEHKMDDKDFTGKCQRTRHKGKPKPRGKQTM